MGCRKFYFQMKERILIGIVALFLGTIIVSCSKYESNLDLLTENIEDSRLNEESLEFKNSIISTLNTQKVSTKSGETVNFTEEQVKDLREKSLDMFASHGFKRSEFKEFLGEGDERIILMATIFTAIIEQEPVYMTPSRIKTKSETDDDDGTCWSFARVTYCAGQAFMSAVGADEIQSWFTGYRCLTKSLVKSIFKTALKKFPYIAAASAIGLFSECMGWLPWQ